MKISAPEIGKPSPPMPNTDRHLPIHCPKCPHVGCTLLVKGITIITVTCASCAHTWATRLDFLPDDVQATVLAILSQV
jgi:transcription elongation factor Elf1